LSLDVTQLVQDLINDPESYRHGFFMGLQSETGTRRQNYASSDHADPTKHPIMRVFFTNSEVDLNATTSLASDTIEMGDTTTITFEVCNNACCDITSESMTLSLPTGFVIASSAVSSSAATFSGSTLAINSLSSNDCFDLIIKASAGAGASLGMNNFCLNPDGSLVANGTLCSGAELIEIQSDTNDTTNTTDTTGTSTSTNWDQFKEVQTAFNIFPNPNTGIFSIQFNSEHELKGLTITNNLGQTMVKTGKVDEGLILLNLENHPKGIYQISALFDFGTVTKKVVLE